MTNPKDYYKREFYSYGRLIAIEYNGEITLTEDWDCTTTTSYYRNQFLKETKLETLKKIKDGTYKVVGVGREN